MCELEDSLLGSLGASPKASKHHMTINSSSDNININNSTNMNSDMQSTAQVNKDGSSSSSSSNTNEHNGTHEMRQAEMSDNAMYKMTQNLADRTADSIAASTAASNTQQHDNVVTTTTAPLKDGGDLSASVHSSSRSMQQHKQTGLLEVIIICELHAIKAIYDDISRSTSS